MERAVDFRKTVKAFGGYTNLSKKLTELSGREVPLSTVHGWKLRKHLPHWREDQIRQLAEAENVDIYRKKRRRMGAASAKPKPRSKRKAS